LDFGPVKFYLARHFGFCYGVENAIEISYRALEENPDKRVYLLSQMIHNPEVNNDLQLRGISFIMDTDGTQFIPWGEIKKDDVVIIPAFGTTLEIERRLAARGVDVQQYDTTCPFVEKVWNQSEKLATKDYTIIIHGKPGHEETRATFSRSASHGAAVIVRDLEEAMALGEYVLGKKPKNEFYLEFAERYSEGFDAERDLQQVGVVNQTTMLASETETIADYFKQLMISQYGSQNLKAHFADTRDTLCYATNDNQEATYKLLNTEADLAIVVGGYNSSNTSHIAELCERNLDTYFIDSEKEIKTVSEIHHYDFHKKEKRVSKNFLPNSHPVRILLTSGASCPDTLVDRIILRILDFFNHAKPVEDLLCDFEL
jgi:4-hydroxy-3-methylbut-2-en-1-yl diphosphate reductase